MSHPKKVVIIRHAEKDGNPAVDDPADGEGLSTRGRTRAAAFAIYLLASFPRPDFIFAAKASKHSKRPVETLTPLSRSMHLDIDSRYADTDFQGLATCLLEETQYADKVILICWHHGKIPEIAKALGAKPPSESWPGHVFDRVWVLDYATGADRGTVVVEDKPQRLLFEDSKQ